MVLNRTAALAGLVLIAAGLAGCDQRPSPQLVAYLRQLDARVSTLEKAQIAARQAAPAVPTVYVLTRTFTVQGLPPRTSQDVFTSEEACLSAAAKDNAEQRQIGATSGNAGSPAPVQFSATCNPP